ncbi:MAG TPA: acyl-CoA dehydratase activase [Thermoleophilia bacterium]|nr:acyl-CoA dehydratase activase [Thermoleophilia bacterium]
MTIFAGVDIGSTTSKAVLIDAAGTILSYEIIDTMHDRDQSGEEVLGAALRAAAKTDADLTLVASTGYGRRSFKRTQKVLPEIVCHARGTEHLYPGVKTIIDVGGQDSKIITVGPHGTVDMFEMNDRCAAGTGRFFEVLSRRLLSVPLEELGPLALTAKNPVFLSSVCTVFAESEIISYLSAGMRAADIAMGILESMAKRVVSIGRQARIDFTSPIVLTGGIALNVAAKKAFEEHLDNEVVALDSPQMPAALGVALIGYEDWTSERQ